MKGLIDKVVTVYEMRANAMSVLMANTQKALEQSEKERKANEQAERIENFVKDLTTDLNNMLTRFWFQDERNRLTDDQANSIADFVNFVKSLTRNVDSLLTRFQKGQTFEEKIDREIKELKVHVKQRLKEFDEALSGHSNTHRKLLCKYVGKIAGGVAGFFRDKNFIVADGSREKIRT